MIPHRIQAAATVFPYNRPAFSTAGTCTQPLLPGGRIIICGEGHCPPVIHSTLSQQQLQKIKTLRCCPLVR